MFVRKNNFLRQNVCNIIFNNLYPSRNSLLVYRASKLRFFSDNCSPPIKIEQHSLGDGVSVSDNSKVELTNNAVNASMGSKVSIRKQIIYQNNQNFNGTASMPSYWDNLPLKNKYFQPRDLLIKALNKELEAYTDAPVVLTGLGGNGKTSLALEVAHQKKEEKQYVFVRFMLMDAAHQRNSIESFAEQCGVIGRDKKTSTALLTEIAHRIQHIPCLIIWDNVEKEADIHDFLPYGTPRNPKQHLIITSRDAIHWNDLPVLSIEAYERKESLAYMKRQMQTIKKEMNLSDANEVSAILGDHPLALELAMGQVCSWLYVREPLKALKERLKEFPLRELNAQREKQFSQAFINEFNLKTLWKIGEENLSPVACTLLRWLSVLDSENLQKELLQKFLSTYYPQLDAIEYNNTIKELSEQSLIKMDDQQCRIHRLLQSSIREEAADYWQKKPTDFEFFVLKGLFVLNNLYFQDIQNMEYTRMGIIHGNAYLLHLFQLSIYPEKPFFVKKLEGSLLVSIAQNEHTMAYYSAAKKHLTQALDIYSNMGEKNRIAIAVTLHQLAHVYQAEGDCKKAKEHYLQSLDMKYDIYGRQVNNNLNIAATLHELGTVSREENNFIAAIDYLTRALAMKHAFYGEKAVNPDIADTLHVIGMVFYETEHYVLSKKYFSEALQMDDIVNGETTPNYRTASTLQQLGNAFLGEKNYESALDYYTQAITMHRAIYGQMANHPSIATTLYQLGSLYEEKGELNQAHAYYIQALTMERAVYGETANHPDIATTLYRLAVFYKNKQEVKLAIQYYQDALTMYKAFSEDKYISKAHNIETALSELSVSPNDNTVLFTSSFSTDNSKASNTKAVKKFNQSPPKRDFSSTSASFHLRQSLATNQMYWCSPIQTR